MSINQSKKNLVPKQKKGSHSDTSHSVKIRTTQQAEELFKTAKNRLLDISNWHKLCGIATATFMLMDESGNKANRLPKAGDHLKIDIPAPGSISGEGYDWVVIEAIENNKNAEADFEELAMKVRPAENPKQPEKEVSHFFKADASSTFSVSRKKNILFAEVHGRNELPNIHKENLIDNIRNSLIALGAAIGLSSAQWKKLVKGLIEFDT